MLSSFTEQLFMLLILSVVLPGQTIYVTEVFYSYQPVTPIGNMLNVVLPSTLYEAAYF